jgi:pimeloyl-ACP methyl ester carboxylesterase
MRIVFKTVKWIFLGLIGLLVLAIIAGLVLKLFSPTPGPTGQMYDIGGFSLHLDCRGEASGKPTLIIESGAGTPALSYHWLMEKLQTDLRICSYDRSGLGYSELGGTPRDPDTVSHELHALLAAADIPPPYLLAGHSLGGPYIRVFEDNYPNEVAGLIFIDSSHPDQIERLKMGEFKPPAILKTLPTLADLGLVQLILKFTGPAMIPEGLPESVVVRQLAQLNNGKTFRGALSEMKAINVISQRARETDGIGARPVLVFTAGEQGDPEAMREMGIDPDLMAVEWLAMQKELAALSTNGRQITIEEGNHMTLFSIEKNADILVAEIRKILD